LVYALEQYVIQRDTHVEHFNVKKIAQVNLEKQKNVHWKKNSIVAQNDALTNANQVLLEINFLNAKNL